MAVQKSRKTPSKRGMHRSHDRLTKPALSKDPTTGETHLRHRVSRDGFYRETDKVRRLAVANYLAARLFMDGDHRVCMLNFVDRDLSIDETFRDEMTGQSCLDFTRETWPHGATGGANPHGVLFVVADADIR